MSTGDYLLYLLFVVDGESFGVNSFEKNTVSTEAFRSRFVIVNYMYMQILRLIVLTT